MGFYCLLCDWFGQPTAYFFVGVYQVVHIINYMFVLNESYYMLTYFSNRFSLS
jgi:hypothetical protein